MTYQEQACVCVCVLLDSAHTQAPGHRPAPTHSLRETHRVRSELLQVKQPLRDKQDTGCVYYRVLDEVHSNEVH